MISIIKWNKKHLSKQVVKINYTLEKINFAVATFEGLGVVSFQTEYMTLRWTSREEKTK